jgi:protein-histidine pros-kinase
MVAGFAAAALQRATTATLVRDSEHRVRAVMESAPDPIVVFDAAGRIVDFSPAAERAFLRTRAEVLGQSAMVLLAPKHVEAFFRWMTAGDKAGSAEYAGRQFESTGRRADGSDFPMEIIITDLREQSRLAAAFIRDLTLRDRLKESRERLASVVSSAPVAILACDLDGTITLAEGSGLAVLNVTPAEVVGRNLRSLAPCHPDATAVIEQLLSGASVGGRLHVMHPDAHIGVAANPMVGDDGSVMGISVVLSDVTARVRAEEAQRESEAKSRLMAMMNHEVRTPLNSILGFAHLLKEVPGELSERQQRYVGNIETAGNHLLELVNDALDLARLDIGRVQLDMGAVPVQQTLERAADQVRPLAEAKGLSVSVLPCPDIAVTADRRQLVQVLLNLLSNAIKHTAAGGSVTLSATRDADRVLLSVQDDGDGIAAEDQPKLFEEFFQARNHAPGGVGLGLSISRRLVQLMGGTIGVESELGRGSTFTVSLRGAAQAPSA